MESKNLTRRNFVTSAAFGAVVAGAAALTGCASGAGDEAEAPADAVEEPAEAAEAVDAAAEAAPEEAASAPAADYQNIYADGVNLMPGRKEKCPGPRGPIAFEAEVDPAVITREEDFDVVVVGAGIGGLMATLKAADMGAKVLTL